jgi:single-stranded-DNA-specific exonuclease
MNKRWKKRDAVADEDVRILMSELGIGRTLASLLVQREVNDLETAKRFFRPQLDDLHDPFLMKDMDLAATRLQDALESGERILVYGDYDVDGTTAVTLVFSFLKNLGASCEFYIPDRYEEGYGFSFKGVDFAASEGITLIITLDCGIKDAEKIVYAKEKGIDVIICDHHNPDQLPPAYAVLDPKRPDCAYPYKGLSGCGVGFNCYFKHGV